MVREKISRRSSGGREWIDMPRSGVDRWIEEDGEAAMVNRELVATFEEEEKGEQESRDRPRFCC